MTAAVSGILSGIEFQMSLLLFVALAGYLLASKINQSAVIGEILVGILVGPGILGLITYTDFVASIAHFGAVVLLFVVGLEFKLGEITKLKYAFIALIGVIVPWIGGYFTAILFGYDFSAALLIGTALTATSIAITANVLKEMGKLQTETAKAIIGAAVIDDILSLLALSMSTEIVAGSFSYSSIIGATIKAGIFLASGILIGNKVINKMVINIDNSEIAKKYPGFIFIFAMMAAFLYSMSAELIGLSAIVGAFIAGVSLEGVGLRHSKNFREGAEYLHMIFASLFFVSLGILVDFHALNFGVIIFVIVLTLVAIATKVIGCGIPALLTGHNAKETLAIGFGMVPRGEVAMIVALLGLNLGLVNSSGYASIVLMSLLTTIITPIVLSNWFYKSPVSYLSMLSKGEKLSIKINRSLQ